MKNFGRTERALVENAFGRESRLSDKERALYDFFQRTLNKERASRMGQEELAIFKGQGIYSDQEIERDMRMVEQDRLNRGKDKTERGEMFEAIMERYADLNEWFGPTMELVPTPEYDDRFNRIDFVLESLDGTIRIGIDVTVSDDWSNINKKVEGIARRIDGGKLSKLKYFSSDTSGLVGFVELPEVVLALDSRRFMDMAELALSVARKEVGSNEKMSQSEFSQMLLLQIIEQLDVQLERFKEFELICPSDKLEKVKVDIETIASARNEMKKILEEKTSPEK